MDSKARAQVGRHRKATCPELLTDSICGLLESRKAAYPIAHTIPLDYGLTYAEPVHLKHAHDDGLAANGD